MATTLRSACKNSGPRLTKKERNVHELANFGDSFELVGRKQGDKLLQLDGRIFGGRFVQRQEICSQHAALSKAVLNDGLCHFFDLEHK